MNESRFHRHDESCRVPLETLFPALPPGKINNFQYYTEVGEDGRIYSRLNGNYALEGCSVMKIPIFLPKKPEGL